MAGLRTDSRRLRDLAAHSFRYRFGPFTLDPFQRVLAREGERVPLSAKAFETLLALVSRPGETVAKRDLLDAVWADTAVEENSLNQCVSAIRKALGESRESPQYIMTVPKTGYRFIAVVEEEVPETRPSSPSPAARSTWRFGVTIAAALGIVAALFVFKLFPFAAGRRTQTAVILSLRGLPANSDSSWLATAVGEMLYHELASPGRLRLIPPEDVTRMQRDLPPRDAASEADRDIRKYTGADLAIGGTVTALPGQPGEPLRIDLRVENLATGEVVATTAVEGPEAETFNMVRRLGEQVRHDLGVALAPSPALRSPIPTSHQAMQLYAGGIAALRAMDFISAKDRLLEAVEADPFNALCYSALSAAWSALGYEANATEAGKRAFELSNSLSELDRLGIEGRYRLANREWRRAAEIYESIWKLTPGSLEDARALIEAYWGEGRNDEARRVVERLRSIPALRDDPRVDLLDAHAYGGTWSDYKRTAALAGAAAEKAARRNMRGLYARARLTQAGAMLTASIPGHEPLLEEARRICSEQQDWLCLSNALRTEGNRNLWADRPRDAEASYRQALDMARKSGNLLETINEWNGLGILHEYATGDLRAAEADYRAALAVETEIRQYLTETHINYSELLIAAGRLDEAGKEAESVLAHAREYHEVQSQANSLNLEVQLNRIGGNPRRAVTLGEQALAMAKQSGSTAAELECEIELGLSVAVTGDIDRARKIFAAADRDASGAGRDRIGVGFYRAQMAAAANDYSTAARLAGETAESARQAHSLAIEIRSQALLSRVLLAQGRREEATAAASQAAAMLNPQDRGIAYIETQFAMRGAKGDAAGLRALGAEAAKAGYLESDLELRMAAARMAGDERALRGVKAEAASRGYLALAGTAR